MRQDTASPTIARPRRPAPLRQLIATLLYAALGGLVGFYGARLLPELRLPGLPWALLIVPLLFFGGVLVHELGHLIGGRLAGFRFFMVAVGPLMLRREVRGLRLRLYVGPLLFGGMAVSLPDDGRDLLRRALIVIAAGPLASLLLAVVGLSLGVAAGTATTLGTLLFLTGLFSGLLLLASLIPNRAGGMMSDGLQMRLILAGNPAALRGTAMQAISAEMIAGRRPREWDGALVEQALSAPDGSGEDAVAALYGAIWAYDRGEVARAGDLIDRALAAQAEVSPMARPAILLEAAYLVAAERGDAALARALLGEARGGMIERHDRLRAEAAVLLAEGRPAEAREAALAGLEALKGSHSAWMRALDEEWLRACLARAEAALAE